MSKKHLGTVEDFSARPTVNGVGVALQGEGSGIVLTTVEVSLGSAPNARSAGHFTITTSGLTSGKPVLIRQANGPYTGKGTRSDEAEMDQIDISGKTISTTVIECFWNSVNRVRGNFKFDYVVSA